jgi:hypothetical protein
MFSRNNFAQNATNIFPDVISVNLIGVPEERKFSMVGFKPVTGPEDRWQNYFAPNPG